MDDRFRITVCTQVYNSKPYLEKCICSVLNQTYKNFEYIIVDNGSTDGSEEILKKYSQNDERIKIIRFDTNKNEQRWIPAVIKNGTGNYVTSLDSDDWWECNYLERLVDLARQDSYDIICTGSYFHYPGENIPTQRSLSQKLILEIDSFIKYFPFYHVYFRTTWAKLIRLEVLRLADYSKLNQAANEEWAYGIDTLASFSWLRISKKIFMDNSVLHHYRIHKKSTSYQYEEKRFISDILLYHDAIDFLSAFGPVSEENRRFLSCVYGNAISDTLNIINSSQLSVSVKLAEMEKITSHPITLSSFRYAGMETSLMRNKEFFLRILLSYGKMSADSATTFQKIVISLCPNAGFIVIPENSSFFLSQQAAFEALLNDNIEKLYCLILDMVSKNQNTKQYNLGKLLQSMTPERSLAHQVDDVRFIRKYRNIYENLCRENYISALDEMTELLLDNAKIYNEEFFLNIYISAAALTEQVPAFLFGKTQLAAFYLQQRRREDCQAVLKELDEMGVESEEIAELRRSSKTVIV